MITELVGIAGGVLILIAFVQVTNGFWNGKSFWYEVCNLVGAVLLGWYAYEKQAYTSIVLNLIWGTVALYAINHALQRHKVRRVNRARVKRVKIRKDRTA